MVNKVGFFRKIFQKKESGLSSQPIIKILVLVVGIFIGVLVIDFVVQYINNDTVVAIVNNSRISKSEWKKRVEKTYGVSMASYMIDKRIIELEAKKSNILLSMRILMERLMS